MPRYYCPTFEEEFSGPNHDVPVVSETTGPYDSLAMALAMNPGSHETTDDEYAAYTAYWNAKED